MRGGRVGLLAAPALIAAAMPDPAPGWAELERASPAELARMIAADAAGEWIEKRVTRIPGVAQWRGINVELASRPRPTDWSGLCAFRVATAYFVPVPDDADRLVLDRRDAAPRYVLAGDRPGLTRADAAATACPAGALAAEGGHRDLVAEAGAAPATPGQAAFAIRAVVAARRGAARVRCRSGAANMCKGVALDRLDLGRMYRITLDRCSDAAASWCVTAQWDRPMGDGPVLAQVATRTSIDAELDDAVPAIRTVRLATYPWPVL